MRELFYYFVSNYKNIVIENLSIKGIQKGMFGKSINNWGWSEFVRQLPYKSEWYESPLYKVDKYFLSIKLYSSCHIKNTTLKLKWY